MTIFRNLPYQSPLYPQATTYVATALQLSKVAAKDLRCVLDIKYSDGPSHCLDIFLPDEIHNTAPVYICIHGGNWSHGFKEFMSFGATHVTQAGAIFVSIDYRLSGEAKFPAALTDCLNAISWVKQHIALFGGDSSRIFLGGHSAGANLAALSVLRRDLHPHYGLDAKDFKGCCAFAGIYDLRLTEAVEIGNTRTAVNAYLEQAESAIDASPTCHTSGNQVPFLITWGESDYPLVKAQSQSFADALIRDGTKTETIELPGMDHFSIHVDQVRRDNVLNKKLAQWFATTGERTIE